MGREDLAIVQIARHGVEGLTSNDPRRNLTYDGCLVLFDDKEAIPDGPIPVRARATFPSTCQLDRAQINKRLRDGRKVKAAGGGYVAGSPPYGSRAEGGNLVPDAAEQAVVARMVKMRKAGSSLAAIADELNGEGIPSKRGGRWSASSVSRVIDPAARERARRQTEVARRRVLFPAA